MFFLNHYQNLWLIFAIVGGFALVLVTILAYMAFWQQRDKTIDEDTVEDAKPSAPLRVWWRAFMPWILILTYAFILVFGIAYTLLMRVRPPNW